MKVYLAGKISGDDRYREKFRRAAEQLTAEGHAVLNPAELPEGMEQQDYMAMCMQMLFTADAAAFLPDWCMSPGASIEYMMCAYIGKPRIMMEDTGWTDR